MIRNVRVRNARAGVGHAQRASKIPRSDGAILRTHAHAAGIANKTIVKGTLSGYLTMEIEGSVTSSASFKTAEG